MNDSISHIQAIQQILAPAVMISACGLLTLGISNKFSLILNRIRALNEEKRRLLAGGKRRARKTEDLRRVENISRQLLRLLGRARLVRNSLFCYFIAIGLFVATSLLIGLDFFIQIAVLQHYVIFFFLFGMIAVFLGVIYGVIDTLNGFEVVKIEVEADA
ncbi:MAG TPA: DUF2721 domain-containing protein [Bacteroidota bacterium]|nr:DUF2721 domain-containing protein [Bacteroidota bacterium]